MWNGGRGKGSTMGTLTVIACEMRFLAMKASTIGLLFLWAVPGASRLGGGLGAVACCVAGAFALALRGFLFGIERSSRGVDC